jgi:hypothetical protein
LKKPPLHRAPPRLLNQTEKDQWKAVFKLASEIKNRAGEIPQDQWLENNHIHMDQAIRFSSRLKSVIERKRGKPFINARYRVSGQRQEQGVTNIFYRRQNAQEDTAVELLPTEKLSIRVLEDAAKLRHRVAFQKLNEEGNPIGEVAIGDFDCIVNGPLYDAMRVANIDPYRARREQMNLLFRTDGPNKLFLTDVRYSNRVPVQDGNSAAINNREGSFGNPQAIEHGAASSAEAVELVERTGTTILTQPNRSQHNESPHRDRNKGWISRAIPSARTGLRRLNKVLQFIPGVNLLNPGTYKMLYQLFRKGPDNLHYETGKPAFQDSDVLKSLQESTDGAIINLLNEGGLKFNVVKNEDNTISLHGSRGFIRASRDAIKLAAKNEIHVDDRNLSPAMREKYLLMRERYRLMKDPSNNRSQVNAQFGSLTKLEQELPSQRNRLPLQLPPSLPLKQQSLPAAGAERAAALQSGNASPYTSSGRARSTTPTGRTSPSRTG